MSKKALRLLELNLSPVLLGNRGDALKIPQLHDWQTAVYSSQDVSTWPARNNVGVRCGKQANGRFLYVFDFDKYAGRIFPEWRKQAEAIVKRPLVVVSTGKGYHVYILSNEPRVERQLAVEPVVDDKGKIKNDVLIEIRGDHQQVVAPGSTHPTGRKYKLTSKVKFDAIPIISSSQFDKLVQAANKYDKKPAKPKVQRMAGTLEGTGELEGVTDCLEYARRFISGAEQAERNGDIRILGNGGLLIQDNGSGWFSFSADKGGGLADLIAWHRNIPIEQARAMLRPKPHGASKFVMYPGETGHVIELHEGQFLGDVAFDLPRHTYLKANTGIGKTTYAINLDGRVLLVVPTIAILEQIHESYPTAGVYYGDMKTVEGGESLIITTPDSLPRIFPKIDAHDYTLVIDEAHNIAVAGYRKRAYDNVVRCLNGDWKRVILMTGTPLPLVTANLEIFKSVPIKSPVRTQKAQRIIYEDGQSLAACVARVPLDNQTGARSLIYLQDKKGKLDKIISLLYQKGFIPEQIAVINSETRHTTEYKTLVEYEAVPDTTRVVIATSVISEGFNIRDEFDTLHLLSQVSSIEAQQIANRFRTASAGVVYWYNRGEGNGRKLTPSRVARQMLADAMRIASELNECDAANLNDDDVGLVAMRRERLLAASRLYTAHLVESEENEETGRKYWQPSPVGVNNAVFTTLKKSEAEHPTLFKNNTAVYGWAWLDDYNDTATLTEAEKQTAVLYAEEKAEERAGLVDLIVHQIFAQGPDVLKHNIRHGTGDATYHAIGKAILSYHEITGSFEAACNAASFTEASTRRINTIKRRLKIQAQKDMPETSVITAVLYQIFDVGERLTPEQIHERITAVYMSDSLVSIFAKEREYIDSNGKPKKRKPLTPRKAVQVLGDYFDMKRVKIPGENERGNGWELVSNCPSIGDFEGATVSLKSIITREFTKFSETVTGVPGFNFETVTKFSETTQYA